VGFARDASTGAALILQHLTDWAGTVESLAETIPHYTIIKAKLPAGALALEEIAGKLIGDGEAGRLDHTDGVKVIWDDHWLHLRKSNTEPIIRVIAEARDPDLARGLVDRALSIGTAAAQA
jgi:phosphomannomutase